MSTTNERIARLNELDQQEENNLPQLIEQQKADIQQTKDAIAHWQSQHEKGDRTATGIVIELNQTLASSEATLVGYEQRLLKTESARKQARIIEIEKILDSVPSLQEELDRLRNPTTP
jgi:hypothetical protein